METFPSNDHGFVKKDKESVNDMYHSGFIGSKKPHILMITNHGIHQWNVIPGLRDTGGQNVFVNQFSEAIASFGFRVTILNRGGYRHPVTGEWQRGYRYRNSDMRIYYLEDGLDEFVRKEDMAERIPFLLEALRKWLDEDSIPVDLIVSHYWDAALLGIKLNESLEKPVKHIWVPHSLGAIKKRNVDPSEWKGLRIDERIETEKRIIDRLDGIASTSGLIGRSLQEDYGYRGPEIFLPPCVDVKRYYPHEVSRDSEVWKYLEEKTGKSIEELERVNIVTEISRTDTTKGKDILIKAFAETVGRVGNTLLVVAIDENRKELADELKSLITSLNIGDNVVPVGSIWNLLPDLYAISDVYCTPAIQEGFGMSAEEAAATGIPIIASDRVPFVTEYLLGRERRDIQIGTMPTDRITIGEGAVVVGSGDIRGFAYAIELLLKDEELRTKLGEKAYSLTIPYFTWEKVVKDFLNTVGVMR